MYTEILKNLCQRKVFYTFEVVGRGSKTQLRVGKNIK